VGALSAQNETAPKEKPERSNSFYFMLPISMGFTSYQLNPVSSSVSFPYSYVNSSTQYIYNGKLATSGFKALAPLWGVALELGFSRSLAFNFLYSNITPTSPLSSSFNLDFTFIYNIQLARNFTLQPAFGMGIVNTDIGYPQSIDNTNKDVLILGTIYTYSTTQSSRYGTTQIISDQTNVAIKDIKEGLIYRLGVRYRPRQFIAFGSSLNIFSRLDDTVLLNISNKSESQNISIPDPRISFQSTNSSGDNLFHAGPLSLRVFIALYLGRS
jgi:hypothetical protein